MYDVDDGDAFTSAGTTVACSSPSAMKGSSTASVCRAVSNRPKFLEQLQLGARRSGIAYARSFCAGLRRWQIHHGRFG